MLTKIGLDFSVWIHITYNWLYAIIKMINIINRYQMS